MGYFRRTCREVKINQVLLGLTLFAQEIEEQCRAYYLFHIRQLLAHAAANICNDLPPPFHYFINMSLQNLQSVLRKIFLSIQYHPSRYII